MRHFHSITIGVILSELKEEGLMTLERSTLNRLEKKLGFSKPTRTDREWRLFTPAKAAAFKIAVLNRYDKPLPAELAGALNDPEVKEVLAQAQKQASENNEV